MKAAAFAVERLLRLDHRGLEGAGSGGHGHVVQVVGEGGPVAVRDFAGREFGQRLPSEGAKSLGIEIIQRHPDDSTLRDEARTTQMKHAGQELAPGEVAGGAHEDHDLRELRTYSVRYLRHYSHPVSNCCGIKNTLCLLPTAR